MDAKFDQLKFLLRGCGRTLVAYSGGVDSTFLAKVAADLLGERMLGDGIAIDPIVGELRAPCDGEVVALYAAGHALTLRSAAGVEILMHIGLETVALGGLGLGFWLYAWRRPLAAGERDPLAGSVVYTWMQNRFYFDELYNLIFIRPTLWLAKWTYTFIDKTIIDGILHGIARAAYQIGLGFRVFDRVVINGGADALADSIKWVSQSFREVQTGRVQNYMLLTLLMSIIIMVVYIFFR